MDRHRRAKDGLPPRSVVNAEGYLDAQAVEAHGLEYERWIDNLVKTGTPKDLTGLAFKLLAFGFVLQLIGAAPLHWLTSS